jgi:hypothetical protein
MKRIWYLVLASACVAALAYAQGAPPPPPDDAQQPAAKRPDAKKWPEGEKALKAAAADWVANFPKKPPPTVMKAFVIAPDWGMVRTPAGIVTGRTAQTVIFVRGGESGRCTQRLCNMRAEEQNGKWGKPFLECVEQFTQRVSCKSVEALAQ